MAMASRMMGWLSLVCSEENTVVVVAVAVVWLVAVEVANNIAWMLRCASTVELLTLQSSELSAQSVSLYAESS